MCVCDCDSADEINALIKYTA